MKILNRIIEYSFYSLFFLVPLVFAGNTSELFEFNKMWLAFGLTIIIATAWITKMILQKSIRIQKTPLDIFILIFLLSQTISTLFSLDQHISWWGYYSRFNGGLLSTICYIFLYYAFVSNLSVKHVLKTLWVTLGSGIIVALWGFPAHFGYDPTCLVFRGTLDTGCWTESFKPTIRTFSTLGQPAWLAAYLAILLPLAMAFGTQAFNKKPNASKITFLIASFLLLIAFFYASLIFANTRAGFIGFFVADAILWIALFYKNLFPRKRLLRYFAFVHVAIFICSFFYGMPHSSLSKFTFSEITKPASAPVLQQTGKQPPPTPSSTGSSASAVNITDSADIRKLVWEGAITAWQANPVFGTGVETFAFAYYKYKPAAHNLTSEWDYLYNKAHNEYLNYLTTTGIFGLGSYLAMIGFFLLTYMRKNVLSKSALSKEHFLLITALVSAYVSILITNFFGFSVVIVNLYLFLIPAFVFILGDMLDPEKTFTFGSSVSSGSSKASHQINPYQWTAIISILIISLFMHISLLQYWSADVAYALGSNLDKVGEFQQAYPQLLQAVNTKSKEPVYQDEFSVNLATLATAFYAQKDTTHAAEFAKNAIALSNDVVEKHPNNIVYWKSRVRLFYTLSETDPQNQQMYFAESLKAINKAAELAPTDAKILYNQGVLYGQTGDAKKGIEILQRATQLKPNYRDAYYALGLFYHQLAVDKDNNIIDMSMHQKSIETYQHILKNVSPGDKQIEDTLKQWNAAK